ncbi:MAG: hypothetical protein ACE5RC_00035 [Nitrosopumilus sp.]
MKKIAIEIEGVKPFLFHKFNIESLQQLSKVKSGSAGNDPEEWKISFFHNNGKLYIPSSYLNSALKNGAVNTKAGRGTLQKSWISAVQVEEEIIYFNREMFENWEETPADKIPVDPLNPVYVDIRMVANPNTKGRNVRYRVALASAWTLKFHLDVDDEILSVAQVKKVVIDTGKLQGIADGRTLGYGRYKLNEFEIIED